MATAAWPGAGPPPLPALGHSRAYSVAVPANSAQRAGGPSACFLHNWDPCERSRSTGSGAIRWRCSRTNRPPRQLHCQAHHRPDPDSPDAGTARAEAAAKVEGDHAIQDKRDGESLGVMKPEAELDGGQSAELASGGRTGDSLKGEDGRAQSSSDSSDSSESGFFLSGVLSSVEETEEEQAKQSSVYRALRMSVIALKSSPWVAVWLLVGITGAILFVDVEGNGQVLRKGIMSPLLMVGSVLGITTVKAKTGSASIGALGSAWGATWRASGFAGVISFYLRGVFAGKRIRVLQYPSTGGVPLSRRKRRMRTVTVRSDSAQVLRERIARSNGLFAKDVRLYLWVTPGLFEYIPDDADLSMVPEQGFVVWARPGAVVPVQGPVLPPELAKPRQQVAAGELSCLLGDLAGLQLERKTEEALVRLALRGDESLAAVHRAYGTGGAVPDAARLRAYALEVLAMHEQQGWDSG